MAVSAMPGQTALIEIPRCFSVGATLRTKPTTACLDDGQIRTQPSLPYVRLTAEIFLRLTFRNDGPHPGAREEGGYACAAGADTFRQGSLRIELKLQFAGQELLLEQLVLADIRRNHLSDLSGLQQLPQTETVSSGVVRNHREARDPRRLDLRNEALGIADETKTAGHDCHSIVEQPRKRLARRLIDLVHSDPNNVRLCSRMN